MKTTNLIDAFDEAFRYLAGLNLQDHPVSEQRRHLEIMHKLREALRPGGEAGPSTPVALEKAAGLFNQKFRNTGWSVRVRSGFLELVYEEKVEKKKKDVPFDDGFIVPQAKFLTAEQIEELSRPRNVDSERREQMHENAEKLRQILGD